VYQEVAVIAQDPFALVVTFDAVGPLPALAELHFNPISDGLILAGVGTRADDEKVGKRGDTGQIEDTDVGGLLFLRRANSNAPAGFFVDFFDFVVDFFDFFFVGVVFRGMSVLQKTRL
jgi:hypothetical protein